MRANDRDDSDAEAECDPSSQRRATTQWIPPTTDRRSEIVAIPRRYHPRLASVAVVVDRADAVDRSTCRTPGCLCVP